MRDGQAPVDDGKCFACGPFSEDGLKLRFERDGEAGARGEVTLDPKFQGYRGIAHGGMVMMLLDEVMAHASGMVGEKAMTASVNVRFRKPVPTGEPLTLRGKVLWQRRTVLSIEGLVLDAGGDVLASAEGSFVTQGRIEAGSLSNMQPGEVI